MARQARRADLVATDGGRIDIRELTDDDVEHVDAVLPLHRLDVAQTYLVAWEGDDPIGHAHIAWSRTKLGVPEVQDVYVLPAHRRRGVASAINGKAEQLAARRGYDRISLSFGVANEPARLLYERLGYTDAGIPPERVRGTIDTRGEPVEIDDTLIYLVKKIAAR